MNVALSPADASASLGAQASAVAEEFLRIIMISEPAGARTFVAPDLQFGFTGESSALDANRCAWVKNVLSPRTWSSAPLHTKRNAGQIWLTMPGALACALRIRSSNFR